MRRLNGKVCWFAGLLAYQFTSSLVHQLPGSSHVRAPRNRPLGAGRRSVRQAAVLSRPFVVIRRRGDGSGRGVASRGARPVHRPVGGGSGGGVRRLDRELHLLSFLPLAALAGFEVLRYEDEAVGRMTKNERGKLWVSEIDLAPRITWKDGRAPSAERQTEMHHRAHEECYIANSVRTEIRVIAANAREHA